MLERERLESKKISKTNAVTSIMEHGFRPTTSIYRPLGLRAVAHRPQVGSHPVEGQAFGDVPLNLEMKLEVWDSPNSAESSPTRCAAAKLALNRGPRRRAGGRPAPT